MNKKILLNRKNKLKSILSRDDSIIIILNPINTYYFSGYESSNSLIIITYNDDYYFTDSRYLEKAQSVIKHLQVKEFHFKNGKFGFLNDFKNIKNCYIEFNYLTVNISSILSNELSNANFIDISSEISKIRAVKDKSEIYYISKASNAASVIINKILKSKQYLKYSEIEINHYLKIDALKNIYYNFAFEPVVAYDENSSVPHHDVSFSKKPKSNVLIDFGVSYKKYKSDLTRTIILNKMKKHKLDYYYSIVEEAYNYAVSCLKPGVNTCDIDSKVREVFKKYNVEELFLHSTGHGIGLEEHEYPSINQRSDYVLEENNIITIEPGLYLHSVGGIRIENTILITKKGCKELTV